MTIIQNNGKSTEKLHIYSDSSSHRGHKNMVVGGVAINACRVAEINEKLNSIKLSASMTSDFKWKGYRAGRKRKVYFELVDYFFELVESGKMHFHVVICSFVDFDHRKMGPGNQESSVNRMYFQLYLHRFCKFYGATCRLYAFPDRGNDSSQVVGFREVICSKAYKRYSAMPNCIPAIQPQSSTSHNIIQMVDVIIGAIAALRESRALNANKSELADYINKASGHCGWENDTDRKAQKLTVWNFKVP